MNETVTPNCGLKVFHCPIMETNACLCESQCDDKSITTALNRTKCDMLQNEWQKDDVLHLFDRTQVTFKRLRSSAQFLTLQAFVCLHTAPMTTKGSHKVMQYKSEIIRMNSDELSFIRIPYL